MTTEFKDMTTLLDILDEYNLQEVVDLLTKYDNEDDIRQLAESISMLLISMSIYIPNHRDFRERMLSEATYVDFKQMILDFGEDSWTCSICGANRPQERHYDWCTDDEQIGDD